MKLKKKHEAEEKNMKLNKKHEAATNTIFSFTIPRIAAIILTGRDIKTQCFNAMKKKSYCILNILL